MVYKFKDGGNGWKTADYNNDLWNILNIAPNTYQNKVTFFKQLIYNKILKGNAYVLIQRNKDLSIKDLQHLDPDLIQVEIRNDRKVYVHSLTSKVYDDADVVHIMNYSTNGFYGISTLTYAADVLQWMAENLRTTKFNNGTPIPQITERWEWVYRTIPGMCG